MHYSTTSIDRRSFQGLLCGLLATMGCRSPVALDLAGWEPPADLPPIEDLAAANNNLALKILLAVEGQAAGANQFLSPLSIQLALCLALEGARGATAQEMGDALQFPKPLAANATDQPWDMPRLRQQIQTFTRWLAPVESQAAQDVRREIASLRKELERANRRTESSRGSFDAVQKHLEAAEKIANQINQLSVLVDQYELQLANGIWVDNNFPLDDQYTSIVEEFYGTAKAERVDFQGAPDTGREQINAWVSQQTRDKIRNILSPGTITPLTRMVLANAIYFKGQWKKPFEIQSTKSEPFRVATGGQTQVDMMHSNWFQAGRYGAFHADGSPFETPQLVASDFDERTGYPAEDGFQAMELDYNGDDISMLFCLPQSVDGLPRLLESLTAEKLQGFNQHLVNREVRLAIPKFKLESTYSLREPLSDLGMQLAFTDSANFQGLTRSTQAEDRLKIALVIHKAFVEVNEQGTEAAAATAVVMAKASAPANREIPFVPAFTADHPFVFFIREKKSGLILFVGSIQNPT